jgi:hypothetical protein
LFDKKDKKSETEDCILEKGFVGSRQEVNQTTTTTTTTAKTTKITDNID